MYSSVTKRDFPPVKIYGHLSRQKEKKEEHSLQKSIERRTARSQPSRRKAKKTCFTKGNSKNVDYSIVESRDSERYGTECGSVSG